MPRRCCTPIPNEFHPSYASILASGDLQRDVNAIEAGPLLPCLTAWCSTCQAPYLITAGMGMFNTPSEHHAHMLTLAKRCKKQNQ